MEIMNSRHGGDIFKFSPKIRNEFIDFSININPLGLSPLGETALEDCWKNEALRYPDTKCRDLIAAISRHYGISSESILIGNGATELMYALMRALQPERVLIPVPSFSEYKLSAEAVHAQIQTFLTVPEKNFCIDADEIEKQMSPGSLLYLGNPNNPDGRILEKDTLCELIRSAEKTSSFVVIDESFIDFLGEEFSYRELCRKSDNVIVLMSLTKFYAVPGLRIGCGFFPAGVKAETEKQLIPWNVNGLAQAYMIKAVYDRDYIDASREYCRKERAFLTEELSCIPGICVLPGTVNFILCRLTGNSVSTAEELQKRLLPYRILVRNCGNYEGLDSSYFRICVHTARNNRLLTQALKEVLK